MYNQARYTNSDNETILFGLYGSNTAVGSFNSIITLDDNDSSKYEWEYDTLNGRISNFHKGIKTFTLPVVVQSLEQEETSDALIDEISRILDVDIAAEKHGKLTVGEWSMDCYAIGLERPEQHVSRNVVRFVITMTTDRPYWYREITHQFRKDASLSDNASRSYVWETDSKDALKRDYRLSFYGAISLTDAKILADAQVLGIDGNVEAGQKITLDTVSRTIINETTGMNAFSKRMSEVADPFPKLLGKKDSYTISWLNKVEFDMTILVERSAFGIQGVYV